MTRICFRRSRASARARRPIACTVGAAVLWVAAAAAAEEGAGAERPPFGPTDVVNAAVLAPRAPDVAKHVGRLPGADVVDNGPLAGQVQYRGLFGPRVNVQVNGTRTNPGGPEWMDAHLHYVPAPLLDEIELQRGISPVSAGAESLGGVVRARTKRTRFLTAPDASVDSATLVEWTPQVDVEIAGRSVDGAFAGGGLVGAANDRHRFHILGSHESGNDYDARAGTIRPTRHARTQYGLAYGFRHRRHELAIEYRHNDTGASGSPALPLDTIFFDTELLDASYRLQTGATTVSARVDWIDVDHRMDNFSLRPQPGNPLFSDAQGGAIGYSLDASHPLAGGVFQVGADGQVTRYDMEVSTTLDTAFFLDAFQDASRDRHGAWGEWRGEAPGGIQARVGVRYTRVSMSAGPVNTSLARDFLPIRRLRDAFNAADRDRSDDLVDWALELAVEPRDALRLSLGAARKERSPSHLERYLWAPLEVSAGLADGNNYVGDLSLKPEVSHEVDGGFEWRQGPLWLAPRAYYRHVDDFIQGTPATNRDVIVISVGQGNSNPLQFSNVEAELYGVDLNWGSELPLGLVLDGTLSYVRGRRRDIDDDLYRLSPLHGRVTLTWLGPLRSSAAVESVFAAGQDRVSVTNRETPTDAWGVLNLRASWEPLSGVDLIVGVNNVVDSDVRHHLAGVNRALGSAVGLGAKIPGTGRSVYGRVRWRW